MGKPLRIGVVGVGFWGTNHVRVLSELPNAKVEAVCDVNEERARLVAAKYGVPSWYRSLDEILSKTEIEALTVCTPSMSHAEVAVKALETGLHVFVEKPLASTVEECIEIIDASKSNKRHVMTGFIERFNPAVGKAVELLNAGEIGDVIMSHGRRIGWWPERIGDVGVVKDTAIHDIDLTRYMFGEDPQHVYARGGKQRHKLEDHVQAILSFSGGLKTAFIEANWLTPRKKRELQITGSEGVLSIQFLTQQVSLEKADMVIEPIIKWQEPLKLELTHFVESVIAGEKPMVDAVDGLKAVAIAEAILRSMKENRIVELDLNKI